MILLKCVVGLGSVLLLLVAYAWAAPGDDPVWRHIFGGLSIVALGIIFASLKYPAFDRIFVIFLITLVVAYAIASFLHSRGAF